MPEKRGILIGGSAACLCSSCMGLVQYICIYIYICVGGGGETRPDLQVQCVCVCVCVCMFLYVFNNLSYMR